MKTERQADRLIGSMKTDRLEGRRADRDSDRQVDRQARRQRDRQGEAGRLVETRTAVRGGGGWVVEAADKQEVRDKRRNTVSKKLTWCFKPSGETPRDKQGKRDNVHADCYSGIHLKKRDTGVLSL